MPGPWVCPHRGVACQDLKGSNLQWASANKMAVSLLCQSGKCVEHVPCLAQVVQFQYGFLHCGDCSIMPQKKKEEKKKERKKAGAAMGTAWKQDAPVFSSHRNSFTFSPASKATLKLIPLGSFTTLSLQSNSAFIRGENEETIATPMFC